MEEKKLKKLTLSEKKGLTFRNNTYKWEPNFDNIVKLRLSDVNFGFDKDERCNCIDRKKISDIEYDIIIKAIIECLEKSGITDMSDQNMIKKAISNICKENTFSKKAELKAEKALEKAEADKIKAEIKADLPNQVYNYLNSAYKDMFEYNINKGRIYYNGDPLEKTELNRITFDVNSHFDEFGVFVSEKLTISVLTDLAKMKKFKETTSVSKDDDVDFDIMRDVVEDKWESYLQTDEKDKLKHTIFNYMLFLTYHPQFKDKIKMNSFDKIEYLVRYDKSFSDITNKPIDDYEADLMKSYIEKYFGSCTSSTFSIALNNVLLRNSYHPLKEYFASLQGTWDGQERVRNMMIKYYDCPDIEPIKEMTEVMMCGAYQRIVEERPDAGVPFDYMGIVIGKQGTGKTKFFTRLFGDRYTIINPDVNDDQSFVDLTNRAWLVLFDEMKAIDKSDMPTVKSRITEQGSNVRLSYGRRSKYYPRHTIYWGNTNEEYFLRDDGYERRFLCFEAAALPRPAEWWKENYTEYIINQLWAETAKIYYEKYEGKIIEISPETQLYNQTVQVRHKIWNDDTRTKLEIGTILTQKYEKIVYFNTDFKQFLRETDVNHIENNTKNEGFSLKIVKNEWILSRFNRKRAWIEGIIMSFGWSKIEVDDDFLGKGTYYLAPNCDYEQIKKEYEESFEKINLMYNNTLDYNDTLFFQGS